MTLSRKKRAAKGSGCPCAGPWTQEAAGYFVVKERSGLGRGYDLAAATAMNLNTHFKEQGTMAGWEKSGSPPLHSYTQRSPGSYLSTKRGMETKSSRGN